ncbi:MAG: hypothetical protein AAGA09_06905 [Pseudomonadota bacterium]
MASQTIETQIAAIGSSAYVTADEVKFLRETIFADGIVCGRELDAIFALANRAPDGDREWPQLFSELVADFYLREEEPRGYLTQSECDALRLRIGDDNANDLHVGMLVELMEKAAKTPPTLSAFTGAAILGAIKKRGGAVTKQDAALIKRLLFATGGAGNIAVTREEAELLFDINDAGADAKHDPAWTELFVTGVINHLMAHLGYQATSREEAFRRDAWKKDQSVNISGFFSRMLSGGLSGLTGSSNGKSVYAAYNEMRDENAEEAAKITPEEADWVADRIGRDGDFNAREKELITQISELAEKLPENLKSLVSKAA